MQRSVHVISYKEASPWQVSEEESLNNATPEYLKCDSCLAVASELARAFHKFERHLSRLLADSEILDIVGMCKSKRHLSSSDHGYLCALPS